MMILSLRGAMSLCGAMSASACAFSVFAVLSPFAAMAQEARERDQAPRPLEIVLTPNRGPTSIQRSGSSISVISADEIAKTGAGGVADVLRTVPGLYISQTGGAASVSNIRMRGANVGHTLVLIDGVRMNDPSSPSAEFDFGMISPTDIERIEVLRGPQSALYGSDAIGGVINIITKRGTPDKPRYSLSLGGGSYGTVETRAGMSGGTGPWTYALSATGFHTNGFSNYGYRLPRLASLGPFERDKADKIGASLRLGYRPNADFSVDASLTHNWSFLHFDSTTGDDRYNRGWARITNGQVNARLATLDGTLTHKVSLFAARTDRFYNFSPFFAPRGTAYDYTGDRYGAEYQGDLKLGAFGTLSLGARYEQERFEAFTELLSRGSGPRTRTNAEAMNTLSAFALHQLQLGERFDLSLAGRVDHVDRAKTFVTGRATASYRIDETGTKFRASIGTGAKSPTLYQLFSVYGDPNLKTESSIGYDAGIEQSLMQGRIKLSLGVFENRIRDMIDFGSLPAPPWGRYINTARARTRGVEAGANIELIEGKANLRASYTFMDAEDSKTHLRLVRRPMHQGSVGLDWKATDKLTLSPTLKVMGARTDIDFNAFFQQVRVRLAPYARLDVAANYQLTDVFSLYARVENLNGARIEDARNYGGTGRAYYGGIKASW